MTQPGRASSSQMSTTATVALWVRRLWHWKGRWREIPILDADVQYDADEQNRKRC